MKNFRQALEIIRFAAGRFFILRGEPVMAHGYLLWKRAQQCGDRPDARLFPHGRQWILYNIKRLCRPAGVPEITAHGARGLHATIDSTSFRWDGKGWYCLGW